MENSTVLNGGRGATNDVLEGNWKIKRLLYILEYLSVTNDDYPSDDVEECIISSVEKNLIFLYMTR